MAARPEIEMSQDNFLRTGGVLALALARKRKDGELASEYVYYDYPKDLRLNRRTEEVECSTETIQGRTRTWTETREVYDLYTVHSEEEEERVLSGGKTSSEVEQERQSLLMRCRAMNIKADPSWSIVRLRRELGDRMDAPATEDREALLTAELAKLRKMAEMQAEIDQLRAQLEGKKAPSSEENDDLRAQLEALGVRVDGRWSPTRMREELEKATAPAAAA